MAVIPYPLTVVTRDAMNIKARKEFVVGVDDNGIENDIESQMALAMAWAGNLLTAYDNVIDGVIESASFRVDIAALGTALKTAAGEQGSAEGATLRYFITPEKLYPMFVPSAKLGVFLTGSGIVDTGDAELVAFSQALDIDVNNVRLLVSDGESINSTLGFTGLLDGYYSTKARQAK